MPTCKVSQLESFNPTMGDSRVLFFSRDMDELMAQDSSVVRIEVGTASCSLSLEEHWPHETQIHTVAYAIKAGSIPLIGPDHMIALPCPPHCGGKLYSGAVKKIIGEYNEAHL